MRLEPPLFWDIGAGPHTRFTAFRPYLTQRHVSRVWEGSVYNFRGWIRALKEGHPDAISLFGTILTALLESPFRSVEAVIPIPPHDPEIQTWPLVEVVDVACSATGRLAWKGSLCRESRVEPWRSEAPTRSVAQHQDSMLLRPGVSSPARLLVVDDVWTSGATLRAAVNLIHHSLPKSSVVAFAFGRAVIWGQKVPPFPESPAFPPRPMINIFEPTGEQD